MYCRVAAMLVREIECKSILSDTGLPADYAINCYVGCEHACCYCYARFMKRFTGHREPWGTWVDVRTNAPAVLAREMRRRPRGSVMLSSVCDGWQPLEDKYGLTRECVRLLTEEGWPVSILTKGAMVRRDLPLLNGRPADMGVTLTAFDEDLRRAIEPCASPTSERVAVLEEAAQRGISVWAFLGPFLPMLTDTEQNLEALVSAVAEVPVTHVYVDRVNFRPGVTASLKQMAARHFPGLAGEYKWLGSDPDADRAYSDHLRSAVERLGERYGIADRLRIGF